MNVPKDNLYMDQHKYHLTYFLTPELDLSLFSSLFLPGYLLIENSVCLGTFFVFNLSSYEMQQADEE